MRWPDRAARAGRTDPFVALQLAVEVDRAGVDRLQPRAMLFDEPTSALDPELVGEVLQVVNDLAQQGMTMVIVTHEIGFARGVADRVVFMEAGRIVEQGVAQILAEPRSDRLKAFLSKAMID